MLLTIIQKSALQIATLIQCRLLQYHSQFHSCLSNYLCHPHFSDSDRSLFDPRKYRLVYTHSVFGAFATSCFTHGGLALARDEFESLTTDCSNPRSDHTVLKDVFSERLTACSPF